ncbi:MAG TPA: urease accessory protein UreE [Chitinophagaceae bacterium]|jgi:urease accessory protein
MLIQQKAGVLGNISLNGRLIDWLYLEWHETNKRILRKRTASGREIALRFLQENPALAENDVLYQDDQSLIVVSISPCDTIVVKPGSPYEMASVCYEIGNKHLPLFYESGELLVPYEDPLFRLLAAGGFNPAREKRKLLQPLKTTVAAHGHNSGSSLFSKILQLTTPSADA